MNTPDRIAKPRLTAVEARPVRVAATDAQDAAALAAASIAEALCERRESVLEPGHTDLLESPVLDAVHVLGDHRMLVGTGKPVQRFVARVAGNRADRKGRESAHTPMVGHVVKIADQHIRPDRVRSSSTK